MKAYYFLSVLLISICFASCSAESNIPVEEPETSAVVLLESRYAATEVAVSSELAELPAISISEAENILAALRNHTNAKEELNVEKEDNPNLRVAIKQTIDNKYAFTIQLNLSSYDDGSLFYNGYESSCSSDLMKWKLTGFALSSDKNKNYCYNFTSDSYLYLKVIEDGVHYLQIPVKIKGNYFTDNHDASYTYTL